MTNAPTPTDGNDFASTLTDTLSTIERQLQQAVPVTEIVEQLTPEFRHEALRWARQLSAWDDARGQYSDQAIGIARVISRRAMRAFGLRLTDDGRIIEIGSSRKNWQTPKPSEEFTIVLGNAPVKVEYTRGFFPDGATDHLSFRSLSPDAGTTIKPHPFSPTGYFGRFFEHDTIEACGGPKACASLFAEMKLRGQDQEFDALFESRFPERQRGPRLIHRRARSTPHEPPIGEHTAAVDAQELAETETPAPPSQRTIF